MDAVSYIITCHNSNALDNKQINILTTTLPLSKVVVYLIVQKSRAGASVNGAYVCSKLNVYSQGSINN